MSDFFNLLSALLAGYLTRGWPFLLAHLFVIYLVRNSWLELNREQRALESWSVPESDQGSEISTSFHDKEVARKHSNHTPEKKRETITVLERFVAESRVMGAKGIFVPMTDFSDRLDSAVEGRIAELHDRTNLFLYVGIAGTMFGVFEFSSLTYQTMVGNTEQSQKLIELGKILSNSMSKAFPVGFFGLLLTFIAQILATRPEQRLREELSEATRRALEARTAATHSQAEVIQQASASIAIAMEPLKNLEVTLSESLKPVVEVFGQRLDKSLRLIEKEFKRLEATSEGMRSAVDEVKSAVSEVKTAVSSIADATKSLNSLTKETPKVIKQLLDLEKKHEESLDQINELFDKHFARTELLTVELQKTVANLSTLSERVIAEASSGTKRVEEAFVTSWTAAAIDFRKNVEIQLNELLKELTNHYDEILAAMGDGLRIMNAVGATSAASITAIGKTSSEIAETYKTSIDKVGQDSFKLWGDLSQKLFGDSQQEYLTYLDQVKKGTLESSGALKNAADKWDELARNSDKVLKEPVQAAVAEARKDLVNHLTSLDTNLEERIKQFAKELDQVKNSTSDLVTKVEEINRALDAWTTRAGPLTKDIVTASESIRQQSEHQVGIVSRLENATKRLTQITARPVSEKIDASVPVTVIESKKRTLWKPKTWFQK